MSSTKVCAASWTGASASPRRRCAQTHLGGRFLARDIDDAAARPRHRRAGLDQQRRLADARLPADQRRRTGHKPAAGDPIELGDAGHEPRLGLGRARQVLERKRAPGRAPSNGRAADAKRRRFLDDRIPLAARFAFSLPALRDRAAVLADIRRTKLGHFVGLAGLPWPVEAFSAASTHLPEVASRSRRPGTHTGGCFANDGDGPAGRRACAGRPDGRCRTRPAARRPGHAA